MQSGARETTDRHVILVTSDGLSSTAQPQVCGGLTVRDCLTRSGELSAYRHRKLSHHVLYESQAHVPIMLKASSNFQQQKDTVAVRICIDF